MVTQFGLLINFALIIAICTLIGVFFGYYTARRMAPKYWDKVWWISGLLLGKIVVSSWFSDYGDDRLGFGPLLTLLFTIAVCLLFVLPMLIRIVRRQHHYYSELEADDAGRRKADWTFAFLANAVTLPLLLFWFPVFARFNGTFTFGLLTSLALLSGLHWILGSRSPLQYATRGTGRLFSGTFSLTLIASLIYALYSALHVATEAKSVSAGRAYCLQSGSKPAESLFDLSILTFRQPYTGGYLKNHGLLVIATDVNPEVFNWSYRANAFVKNALTQHPNESSRPTLTCEPD